MLTTKSLSWEACAFAFAMVTVAPPRAARADSIVLTKHDGAIEIKRPVDHPEACGEPELGRLARVVSRIRSISTDAEAMAIHTVDGKTAVPYMVNRSCGDEHETVAFLRTNDDPALTFMVVLGRTPHAVDVYLLQRAGARAAGAPLRTCYEHWHGLDDRGPVDADTAERE